MKLTGFATKESSNLVSSVGLVELIVSAILAGGVVADVIDKLEF